MKKLEEEISVCMFAKKLVKKCLRSIHTLQPDQRSTRCKELFHQFEPVPCLVQNVSHLVFGWIIFKF